MAVRTADIAWYMLLHMEKGSKRCQRRLRGPKGSPRGPQDASKMAPGSHDDIWATSISQTMRQSY
eukprot:9201528-Pyramimonas_sp.AAC.1